MITTLKFARSITRYYYCFNRLFSAKIQPFLPITNKLGAGTAKINRTLIRSFYHRTLIVSSLRNFSDKSQTTSAVKNEYRPHNVNTIKDLIKCINEGKHIHLRFIRNILDQLEDFNTLKPEEVIILLENCGSCIPNESSCSRDTECQRIYREIQNVMESPSLDVYHTYISVCTQNRILLIYKDVLNSMKCKPNKETYKLLLRNVCERGDVIQQREILKDMREENISVDEEIFSLLVMCHSICGGITSGEKVLETMKAAKVPESDNVRFSLIKGLTSRQDLEEFKLALERYPVKFEASQVLQLLELISLNENNHWLNEVFHLLEPKALTREIIRKIEQLCIFLINMSKLEAAVQIYTAYIRSTTEASTYALLLFREMLHRDVPIETIIRLAKDVQNAELNDHLLFRIAEVALKHRYCDSALKIFEHLAFLRPHFFWPLLVDAKANDGDSGIMVILEKMVEMKVPIDRDTLENYCLPHFDLSDPKILIEKFKKLELTAKEVVNSLVPVYLNKKDVNSATNIIKMYDVRLTNDTILKRLPITWSNTHKSRQLVQVLQKVCESLNSVDDDHVGDFLIKSFRLSHAKQEYRKFLDLLKEVGTARLRINSTSADILYNLCKTHVTNERIHKQIFKLIDDLQDYSMKTDVRIPHPRNMNVEQLECHLLELKSKQLETRGVLRKLIQKHTSAGNHKRVSELWDEFKASGYADSPGMKASSMYSYIQAGSLEEALKVYQEIKSEHPKFDMDHFKVLDLAALMVKEGKAADALTIVKSHTTTRALKNIQAIERNCTNLLKSYTDSQSQLDMFDVLIKCGYCKPSNVVLGPLVRCHIQSGDVAKAVETYETLAATHNCTPLKLELMAATLDTENTALFQRVVDVVAQIHGKDDAHESVIDILCEKKLLKPLQKFLDESGFKLKDNRLTKLCDRWVLEGKLDQLLTLQRASEGVGNMNLNIINRSILKVYGLNKDCEGAIAFYRHLLDSEVRVDKDFESEVEKLLTKLNYKIPDTLKLS